jgi:hypothetical protein
LLAIEHCSQGSLGAHTSLVGVIAAAQIRSSSPACARISPSIVVVGDSQARELVHENIATRRQAQAAASVPRPKSELYGPRRVIDGLERNPHRLFIATSGVPQVNVPIGEHGERSARRAQRDAQRPLRQCGALDDGTGVKPRDAALHYRHHRAVGRDCKLTGAAEGIRKVRSSAGAASSAIVRGVGSISLSHSPPSARRNASRSRDLKHLPNPPNSQD